MKNFFSGRTGRNRAEINNIFHKLEVAQMPVKAPLVRRLFIDTLVKATFKN
ncbi:hypothetical protein EBME_0518 [bacterium endosymbiont of Mortierella elongata FMR23-6]|nr:hypothetical protein EBME_0518 [bacterium endosymbiont of Mortierella elongata FMR23-6]